MSVYFYLSFVFDKSRSLQAATLGHGLMMWSQRDEERVAQLSRRVSELKALLADNTRLRELELENKKLKKELDDLRGHHADYEARMDGESSYLDGLRSYLRVMS